MMYWLSNAIWLGGTLTGRDDRRHRRLLHSQPPARHERHRSSSGSIFTWVTILLSVINLKYGKWTGNIGTVLKGIIMVVLGVLGILFLARHGMPKGIAPASSYTPSITGFLADHRRHRLPLGRLRARRARPAKRWSTRRRTFRGRSSAPALITTIMYIAVMLVHAARAHREGPRHGDRASPPRFRPS